MPSSKKGTPSRRAAGLGKQRSAARGGAALRKRGRAGTRIPARRSAGRLGTSGSSLSGRAAIGMHGLAARSIRNISKTVLLFTLASIGKKMCHFGKFVVIIIC